MSKYAAVNVKFGADISQFSTAMQNAAREMKKAGDQLKNVGQSMTMNLTAPIVALGAAALYSFGQIDSLKRGLISFSGSAQLAEEEFTKLRDVAKLPGIGLEEAVKGSINLQAIGISADDARVAMKAFGNAIATVGGGKENFDLAIRGFSQLTNASKPLQQDLYQIANQLPQVNKLMIEAFGTNRAEDLAKMGISGKQLADFLVTKLGELPKVSGGIKNSFENMSDSVKISLASFGEAIEKNFDISGKINDLSNALSGLINGFSNLKPETQKFILSIIGAVAVIGPLVLGIGVLVNLLPTLMAGFGVFRGAVVLATTALKALSVAMNANWVVALTGALVLAVIAMKNWGDSTSETTERLKKQREETKKLADEKDRLDNPLLNKKKADPLEGIDLYGKSSGYDSFRNKGFEGGGGEYTYMGDVNKAIDNTQKKQKQLTEAEKKAIEKAGKEARQAEEEQSKLNGQQTILNWQQQEYWNSIGIENFNSSFSGIVDAGPVIEEGTSFTVQRINNMRVAIKNAMDAIALETQQKWDNMAMIFQSGIENMVVDLATALGENLADGDPFKDLGNILLSSLGKLMIALGTAMITFSSLSETFKTMMTNPATWGAAIPVGIAMVVAGAAISKIAAKGMQGSSGSYATSTSNTGNSSSSGGNLTLTTRVDGRDLVISGNNTGRVVRR